jgi:hypothetical protein
VLRLLHLWLLQSRHMAVAHCLADLHQLLLPSPNRQHLQLLQTSLVLHCLDLLRALLQKLLLHPNRCHTVQQCLQIP